MYIKGNDPQGDSKQIIALHPLSPVFFAEPMRASLLAGRAQIGKQRTTRLSHQRGGLNIHTLKELK